MATWTEKRKEYENEGCMYLGQIVKDGWTVTPTEDPYATYDATLANSTSEYRCENKVRRYDLDRLDTIYLAKKKLDPTVKYYVECFPRNSTALVITYETISKGIEDGEIDIKKIAVPRGQLKYEEGVDTIIEDLENLVIPKYLFQPYPIHSRPASACNAQGARRRT